MFGFFQIFPYIILLINLLPSGTELKTTLKPPLKIPIYLSANFGELRIDHFHSGVDIKTQGTIGKEVFSSDAGYIYRISVSPGGFGKALYIKHPSGYSTVYGHLDRFTPEIEKYVKSQQYERKSYLVNLFPSKERFPVTSGQLIAYSGNSGSSSGPHLHYEIRKSDSEAPMNPLLFDICPKDNLKPVIENLVIYPINKNTLINGASKSKRFTITGSDGRYVISQPVEINISGMAGFGIKSYDLSNESNNKFSVYSIQLKIDSLTIYKYIMHDFSFDESRYINSHIDYETYIKEKIYIERTYVLPNDKLSVYEKLVNRGIFNFRDDRIHHAEIIVSDINNNKSILSFKIKSGISARRSESRIEDDNLKIMPYNKSNKFYSENVIVNIPSGALYDTLLFSFKSTKGTKEMYSDIYHVHNKLTPLQKPYTLSIKPFNVPAGKESKMVIVQLENNTKDAIICSWSDEYLNAEVSSFGSFYVGIDTIPPVISVNGLTSGADLSGKNELRIKISDNFSGIKSYEPVIDGKWALFEYDQKNNTIIYQFDKDKILKGTKHNFQLKVTDNTNNTSIYKCNFKW
jgi:hypothetical protein